MALVLDTGPVLALLDGDDLDDAVESGEVPRVARVELESIGDSGGDDDKIGEPGAASASGLSCTGEDSTVRASGVGVEGKSVPGAGGPLGVAALDELVHGGGVGDDRGSATPWAWKSSGNRFAHIEMELIEGAGPLETILDYLAGNPMVSTRLFVRGPNEDMTYRFKGRADCEPRQGRDDFVCFAARPGQTVITRLAPNEPARPILRMPVEASAMFAVQEDRMLLSDGGHVIVAELKEDGTVLRLHTAGFPLAAAIAPKAVATIESDTGGTWYRVYGLMPAPQ